MKSRHVRSMDPEVVVFLCGRLDMNTIMIKAKA